MGTHWGSKSERSSRLEAAAEKRETRRGDAQREKDKEREKDQRATREKETRLRGIVEGQDKACEKQGQKNKTGKNTSAEEIEQILEQEIELSVRLVFSWSFKANLLKSRAMPELELERDRDCARAYVRICVRECAYERAHMCVCQSEFTLLLISIPSRAKKMLTSQNAKCQK